jgi:hypothetical protein
MYHGEKHRGHQQGWYALKCAKDPGAKAEFARVRREWRATTEGHIKNVAYRARADARRHGWAALDPTTLTPYPVDHFCELCEKQLNSKIRLSADHDHNTGEFRGWICHPCNQRISWVEELGIAKIKRWIKHEKIYEATEPFYGGFIREGYEAEAALSLGG